MSRGFIMDRLEDMLAYTALENDPVKVVEALRNDIKRIVNEETEGTSVAEDFHCFPAKKHYDDSLEGMLNVKNADDTLLNELTSLPGNKEYFG